MVRNGTRRCDLCASEILGRGGADICVICRIAMDDDSEYAMHASHEVDSAAAEGFALTAIVGKSDLAADEAVAANDEVTQTAAHLRRPHVCKRSDVEAMVQRFAAGLRSFSRRRVDGRR